MIINKSGWVLTRNLIIIALLLCVVASAVYFAQKQQSAIDSMPDDATLPTKVINYVNEHYSNKAEEKRAMLQMATSLQQTLNPKDKSEEIEKHTYLSLRCLGAVFGEGSADGKLNELQKLIYDTPEKLQAYLQWNDRKSGQLLYYDRS